MQWKKRHSQRFWLVFLIAGAIAFLLHWGGVLWSTAPQESVNLQQLYNRSAQYHGPERNPAIVIPGVVGSALTNLDQETVWGQFSLSSDLTRIALPLQGSETEQNMLKPTSVLASVQLNFIGWRFEQEIYRRILLALGSLGGYRDSNLEWDAVNYGDDHFTCFQFPYDWRQDNAVNAKRLHAFILEKRDYLQQEYKERYAIENADIKFDIVAHSMGGLLTRYFLRYGDRDLPEQGDLPAVTWAGAKYVRRAILIGPPNAGTLNALVTLTHGLTTRPPNFFAEPVPALGRWAGKHGFGPANANSTMAVMGTFPSIYQLIPRARHHPVVLDSEPQPTSLFDAELWERRQWGLMSPKVDKMLKRFLPDVPDAGDRRQVARDTVVRYLKRAERFTQALDQPAPPPPNLELYAIAGDGLMTTHSVAMDERGGFRVLRLAPGDGAVLRSSAILDERTEEDWQPLLRSPIPWKQISFYVQGHMQLVQNPSLLDNLLFTLLEQP